MVKKGSVKIWGWNISLGVISLVTLVIFVMALRVIFYKWFAEWAIWIAIISGIALIIFVSTGTLKIRSILNRAKL